MTKNAVRQLYEEWRVSRYLARSNAKYDAVVAVTADIFPFYNISKLSLIHISEPTRPY